MIDFKQEYLNSFTGTISVIKGVNIKFIQTEPNFWEGEILHIPKQWFLEMNWNKKFQSKRNIIGFWQVWYYGTNKLVFDYEFSSLKDIVNLIDFNIRLGVKY